MRVADNMAFDQVRSNLGKNRSQMSELQNQAATQKRVTKPSDDPVAASRVLHSRIDFQGNKQYVKNLNYARSYLEMTDQALSEITDSLVRAKELALSQSNDASASEQTRRAVATEVSQIHDQIVNIGNRKLGDRFIFGGYKTQVRPFDQTGAYFGDSGQMMIHVDKASFLPMNVPGDRLFLGLGLSADRMGHVTPEQATSVEEFRKQQSEPERTPAQPQTTSPDLRGPASVTEEPEVSEMSSNGVNLFKILKGLEISLEVNDKAGVQDTLDLLDAAMEQVVLARAKVGSRGMAVDSTLASLEKAKVDNQISISQFEDADVFNTVSEMNKTESTLQATLQTSGKLIQSSLMDFLR